MISVPNPMTTGRPMTVLSLLAKLDGGFSGREAEEFPAKFLQEMPSPPLAELPG